MSKPLSKPLLVVFVAGLWAVFALGHIVANEYGMLAGSVAYFAAIIALSCAYKGGGASGR